MHPQGGHGLCMQALIVRKPWDSGQDSQQLAQIGHNTGSRAQLAHDRKQCGLRWQPHHKDSFDHCVTCVNVKCRSCRSVLSCQGVKRNLHSEFQWSLECCSSHCARRCKGHMFQTSQRRDATLVHAVSCTVGLEYTNETVLMYIHCDTSMGYTHNSIYLHLQYCTSELVWSVACCVSARA